MVQHPYHYLSALKFPVDTPDSSRFLKPLRISVMVPYAGYIRLPALQHARMGQSESGSRNHSVPLYLHVNNNVSPILPLNRSIMKLTVFTPTYNRAHTLRRVYESLCTQTHSGDFEWLVIDDGSTDFTRQLVESFI